MLIMGWAMTHGGWLVTGRGRTVTDSWTVLLLLLVQLFCLSLPATAQPPLQRFEYSQQHMGTLFRIVLYAPDSTQARQAAGAAFGRIAFLDSLLSDYRPASELNQLSRTAGSGQWVAVSPDLWRLLRLSAAISRKTRGAFDVTVGPYTHLWRRVRRQGVLPAPEVLAQARQAVGYRHLGFDEKKRAVRLAVPGMQLDMGAIGKGYAVDEALEVISRRGLKSALVDGGGNIVVSNPPPGTKGWQVSISVPAPADTSRMIGLQLRHQAVATSGDLYQYLRLDGVRYSHILNPVTGLGLTDQSLVTIVARTGLEADWLSTAISVLGPKQGLQLADRRPGAAAHFVRRLSGQLQQWRSKRFNY
jgi:thiamine biosynthesis lipoprotein